MSELAGAAAAAARRSNAKRKRHRVRGHWVYDDEATAVVLPETGGIKPMVEAEYDPRYPLGNNGRKIVEPVGVPVNVIGFPKLRTGRLPMESVIAETPPWAGDAATVKNGKLTYTDIPVGGPIGRDTQNDGYFGIGDMFPVFSPGAFGIGVNGQPIQTGDVIRINSQSGASNSTLQSVLANLPNILGGVSQVILSTHSQQQINPSYQYPAQQYPQQVYAATQGQTAQYATNSAIANQTAGAGADAGAAVGGALGQLGQFFNDHPFIIGGLVLGGVLLFMKPPSRR